MSSAEDNLDRVFGSDSDSLQSGPEITEPKDEFGIFEDDTENNQAEETPRTSGGNEEPHISRMSSRKRTLADVKVKEMSVRRLWAPRDTGRTVNTYSYIVSNTLSIANVAENARLPGNPTRVLRS